ncbi:MAG: YgcG family protein [Pseudorhodoplanes sp.]
MPAVLTKAFSRFQALPRRLAGALVAGLLAMLMPAAALDFPSLDGRVVDQAGILDGVTRVRLSEKLAAQESRTTQQIVVATVSSLQGDTIENYANLLFRHWRLGQKDANNGVLLLVAPHERKVRIEVGYGLEGALTDAMSKHIIESAILPAFKAGDFGRGIESGVARILDVLEGESAGSKSALAPLWLSSLGDALLSVLAGAAIFLAAAGTFGLFPFVLAFIVLTILVQIGTALGLVPEPRKRTGFWKVLNVFTPSRGGSSGSSSGGWSSSSGSSSSSSSSSSGGGSSGGGGASGSW